MNKEISYMKVRMDNGEDRFVPLHVYDKVAEGVKNLRENNKHLPKPVRWLIKKAIKDVDPKDHIELSLRGLMTSVEELGGEVVWKETA